MKPNRGTSVISLISPVFSPCFLKESQSQAGLGAVLCQWESAGNDVWELDRSATATAFTKQSWAASYRVPDTLRTCRNQENINIYV